VAKNRRRANSKLKPAASSSKKPARSAPSVTETQYIAARGAGTGEAIIIDKPMIYSKAKLSSPCRDNWRRQHIGVANRHISNIKSIEIAMAAIKRSQNVVTKVTSTQLATGKRHGK